ncbi:hypothetical protein PAPYR_12124 [Paratrimastix pyriformis]|uniref:Uncharacterized protein n=1 Tax=Paratrimastix pyriformis TaxID=342808 RepID=A0ABQ8U729_9EUKA|nr:hypothetical protein PAPYR_12124 [Paratrimastix pyriformis]
MFPVRLDPLLVKISWSPIQFPAAPYEIKLSAQDAACPGPADGRHYSRPDRHTPIRRTGFDQRPVGVGSNVRARKVAPMALYKGHQSVFPSAMVSRVQVRPTDPEDNPKTTLSQDVRPKEIDQAPAALPAHLSRPEVAPGVFYKGGPHGFLDLQTPSVQVRPTGTCTFTIQMRPDG